MGGKKRQKLAQTKKDTASHQNFQLFSTYR